MDNLTNEQKYLLASMYKEILSRQPALSFGEANYFCDSDEVRDLFLPSASSDYVSDLCWKLHRKGYLVCYPGDNLANDIELTDDVIICMENKFKNGLKDVVNFLSKFIP